MEAFYLTAPSSFLGPEMLLLIHLPRHSDGLVRGYRTPQGKEGGGLEWLPKSRFRCCGQRAWGEVGFRCRVTLRVLGSGLGLLEKSRLRQLLG